jgi:hypothetical protein
MSISKQEIMDAYQFRHACKVFDDNKKISEEDFKSTPKNKTDLR